MKERISKLEEFAECSKVRTNEHQTIIKDHVMEINKILEVLEDFSEWTKVKIHEHQRIIHNHVMEMDKILEVLVDIKDLLACIKGGM